MSDKKVYGTDDLLSLFEDSLTPQDVLSAKLMAQISSAITSERLRLRMSQQEFADHINVPQSSSRARPAKNVLKIFRY